MKIPEIKINTAKQNQIKFNSVQIKSINKKLEIKFIKTLNFNRIKKIVLLIKKNSQKNCLKK